MSTSREPASASAPQSDDEPISEAKVAEIIEEFEAESATRQFSGLWRWIAGALAVGLAAYALYWTQYSITTQVYRASFLLLVLTLSFIYYPMFKADRKRVMWYDLVLIALAATSLIFLLLNYKAALQRAVNPTPVEVILGGTLIVLTMEATRRTTGWALPITAVLFILYALFGPYMPEPFDHRGYGFERIIGKNYLTLEGIFGVPLDVAATFIVLFTIYGAVLEYSGAGQFFLDWAFAALGRSKSGAGPGRTVTAAGFLLGTVSGSGVATTVTLGSLAWPMLKKAGYDRETAGGVLSAAGIGATLSPPTLGAAAFLIAEYLDISYLEVLVMAAIPTVLYYLSCLLMIEADSRRMRTHAVAIETRPLLELTLKYGYHFSSLFAVAILMAVGFSPFLAVFWSIVIAFGLSFIRADTRLTSLRGLAVGAVVAYPLAVVWQYVSDGLGALGRGAEVPGLALAQRPSVIVFWGMMAAMVASAVLAWAAQRRGREPDEGAYRLLRGLESGGRSAVSIAATTAIAGVIVSVVTLTGLGLKISGLIVDLAGGQVFFTVLFAAVAVWILGLAVPVTASYIIAAVMIVPALTEIGVPEAAAHMFIFYYAVLADVSPPTALAPFAAAAITGGNPFRTVMLAWKYCLPAFLVPFMFTLSLDGAGLLLLLPSPLPAGDPGFVLPAGSLTAEWMAVFGQGGWVGLLVTFLTACVAVAALAAAFGGWMVRQASLAERVVMGVAGFALLYADTRLDLLGAALLIVGLGMHVLRVRRGAAPLGAGST
ncbi:MAG: TRAP transporter fused permease subunit [Chloroflexi bacterium OHK40]